MEVRTPFIKMQRLQSSRINWNYSYEDDSSKARQKINYDVKRKKLRLSGFAYTIVLQDIIYIRNYHNVNHKKLKIDLFYTAKNLYFKCIKNAANGSYNI